jgi:cholesterol transport system auxiliary component
MHIASTTKQIANNIHSTWTWGLLGLMLALLGGCALPERPVRATVYDFGPGLLATPPATRIAPLPPVALAEVASAPSLDSTAVLYRLAYANAFQLQPYAQARWSMTPAQLVHQRLREGLGARRAVLAAEDSAQAAADGVRPRVLRVELDEFSHLFEAPDRSAGLVRLRATLLEPTASGERLLAQRQVIVQRPAASGDAPGGVRALAAATDAAVAELLQWLDTVPRQ